MYRNESGAVLTVGDEDDADSMCTDALMPVVTTAPPVIGPLGKQYYTDATALRATITTAGVSGNGTFNLRYVWWAKC